MNTTLSDNIRAFRKAKSLTQEQLAAALGVTVGAVYKWEAKLSTPDIHFILDLADLFGVSVDVLLGYAQKDNTRRATVARLKKFLQNKDPNGLPEAEKALMRYPNALEVVYQSAILYKQIGFMQGRKELAVRALELLERALLLTGQSDDPKISEFSLRREIADTYADMGQHEKAVELFREIDFCGVNDDVIGYLLATACDRPDEALPFLSMALLHNIEFLTRVIIGYFHVYFQKQDFSAAADILRFGLRLFADYKKPGEVCSLDKTDAVLSVSLAATQLALGDPDAAREALRTAKEMAESFDRAPDYGVDRIRFVSPCSFQTSYDDLGETAMDAVLREVKTYQNEELWALWQEMCSNEK